MSSYDNDLETAENEWGKEYPWRVYDDWNDRLPNMPESPIEIIPAGVFSFLQIIVLMRARILDTLQFARELMI